MSFDVKVLADSTHRGGKRLTTFEVRYPRFIHAELMTYRVFSRNASSSRAIPIGKMIEMVKADPAMPVRWGRNGKGMQDHGEMTPEHAAKAKRIWLQARDAAVKKASEMLAMGEDGPHKQIVNRLLEPWMHITVVVTSTEWSNFFAQRRHKDAQPEIKHLADLMWDARQGSEPRLLSPGEWHLPYIQEFERAGLFDLPEESREDGLEKLIKVSVARCARTSYRTFNGKVASFEEDLALYEKLVGSYPMHASPTEHQATPDVWRVLSEPGKKPRKVWEQPEMHGNLPTWVQFRKTLNGENITNYNPKN